MSRQVASATDKVGLTSSTTGGVAGRNQPFAVICWFNSPDNAAGSNFANIYDEVDNAVEVIFSLQMNQLGRVRAFYRPGGFGQPSLSLDSADGLDDSLWHWAFFSSRTTSDHEFYIDGVSVATSTTAITNSQTHNRVDFGGNGTATLPSGGLLARLMTFDFALTLGEAKSLAYGRLVRKPHLYWECGIGSPEPDWSGNGLNGTVTGASVGAHCPTPRVFGAR